MRVFRLNPLIPSLVISTPFLATCLRFRSVSLRYRVSLPSASKRIPISLISRAESIALLSLVYPNLFRSGGVCSGCKSNYINSCTCPSNFAFLDFCNTAIITCIGFAECEDVLSMPACTPALLQPGPPRSSSSIKSRTSMHTSTPAPSPSPSLLSSFAKTKSVIASSSSIAISSSGSGPDTTSSTSSAAPKFTTSTPGALTSMSSSDTGSNASVVSTKASSSNNVQTTTGGQGGSTGTARPSSGGARARDATTLGVVISLAGFLLLGFCH
ncbi:hypothetical protein B0H63DRAFT_156546 [Podospora didyma]|uniref:Uncharacterized protein n=1 Tax=Podospora didyma TaxID=330526 RepID=A0AAE0NTD5_9PEZI|nr:hypothetical protein B0H63DRAFT_156546 [Podospora didyma]